MHLVPSIIDFLGYVPFRNGQSLPAKLKLYRRTHGLSQEDLAERLGVNESTVARWERARSQPAERALVRLHDLIGIVS